jgi:hypothetical protein
MRHRCDMFIAGEYEAAIDLLMPAEVDNLYSGTSLSNMALSKLSLVEKAIKENKSDTAALVDDAKSALNSAERALRKMPIPFHPPSEVKKLYRLDVPTLDDPTLKYILPGFKRLLFDYSGADDNGDNSSNWLMKQSGIEDSSLLPPLPDDGEFEWVKDAKESNCK